MDGEDSLTTTKDDDEGAHVAVVGEMLDTPLAYKHRRKHIVSVRVHVCRRTRGDGG